MAKLKLEEWSEKVNAMTYVRKICVMHFYHRKSEIKEFLKLLTDAFSFFFIST